jgi:hypothetical protein
VRTISTSCCTGAGLKKCTPITRPGEELAVEISVTERLEVLVARIVSEPTIASSWRKSAFLVSSDSTTASTTRSAAATSSSEVLKVILSISSACSGSVSFSRFTARVVECSRYCRPRASASVSFSTPTTAYPLRAKTSAMPAPMVPRPMTPMVVKVRGSTARVAGEVVMRRIVARGPRPGYGVVHSRVT